MYRVQPKARPAGKRPNYLRDIGYGFDLRRELFYRGFDACPQGHFVDAARIACAFEAYGDVFAVFDADERNVSAIGIQERTDFFERLFDVEGKFFCVHISDF